MQDLSKPIEYLVPSSQEGGNLVQADLPDRTMTAPGSEPVTPLPPALDQSHPTPNASEPYQDGPLDLPVLIPVGDTRRRVRTLGAAPDYPGTWNTTPSAKENLRAAAK